MVDIGKALYAAALLQIDILVHCVHMRPQSFRSSARSFDQPAKIT